MAYDFRKSICKTLWKVSITFLIIIFSYESIIGGSLANALSELVEGCPKKLVSTCLGNFKVLNKLIQLNY